MVKNAYCKFTFKKLTQMITEIKNDSDINEAIEALEQTKILQKENLTHSFELKVQSLKPANLIKSVVSQVTTNLP